ncbi:MAG: single-stranded-DNA-specific exonuclease RecJ [Ichthyobacteriaceae bacterium]|nr:single-stranded-DNA-specific exonuclease RecJ [Ichthyobacteriaceae bacterium]
METKWNLSKEENKQVIEKLKKEVYNDNIIAELLVQRGIEDFESAKDFFRPSLDKLHNPFLMKDMDKAVERLDFAITNNERILIYGDYDVDGTTSVALMYSFLKKRYPNVDVYVPDRYNEGYGVSIAGIDYASETNCDLIIALDCGIKANDKIDYAITKNIDFIVCDHHNPGKELPNAVAVLDPKREDCNYPYKELSGCGVGFKLLQGYSEKKSIEKNELLQHLDLVAVSIGADIVPITGENRILTYYGLKQLNQHPRAGFKAIMEQYDIPEFNVTDVVFKIAPRINAAGRMKHGKYAVRLMIQPDLEQARIQAEKINEYNKNRKLKDQEITIEALKQKEDNNEQDNFSTVVYHPDWHKGVIGIVASRLIEKYHRPTVVFTSSGIDTMAGSVRSVVGFNVYDALESCSELIEQFGGHKYAAGLTIKKENYTEFRNKFEAEVKSTISEDSLIPQINIAATITLNDINNKFYKILKQFEPFGPENMRPVFMSKLLVDNGKGRLVGENKDHIRLNIKHPDSHITIIGIGFSMADKYNYVTGNQEFSAVYEIDENTWKGNTSLQLMLKDIKQTT